MRQWDVLHGAKGVVLMQEREVVVAAANFGREQRQPRHPSSTDHQRSATPDHLHRRPT